MTPPLYTPLTSAQAYLLAKADCIDAQDQLMQSRLSRHEYTPPLVCSLI